MTTTIGPMLENCCGCCGDDGCKNTWAINIQSTNPECLRVDTSECWVVKLEPVCPPEVIAWENVTVDVIDCEEGADCSKKYKVNANCKDEKVKACDGDTTPGYLDEKLEAGHWIKITKDWCAEETNASLRISVDEDDIDFEYPEIKVEWGSKLINLRPGWDDGHTLYLSDKEDETYNNMVCIGFTADYDYTVKITWWGNAETPLFIWENGKNWTIFTGNHDMAKSNWIKILADWYYRLFWQLTVENNIDEDFYFNLWRWLLRVNWTRTILNNNMYLSTAKHWAYARQILLDAWSWIDVTNAWIIKSWNWDWQTAAWFTWPWMTFNIDTLVDLRKGDVVTLWYRPQSNNKSSTSSETVYWTFRVVWQNDSSTSYNALFGWTLLWCYQLAPKCFQEWDWNEVYWTI